MNPTLRQGDATEAPPIRWQAAGSRRTPGSPETIPALAPAGLPLHTLVDQYLAEQRNLTAVDQFSRWQDRPASHPHEPALAPHYRKLLPMARPRAGEQYAFQVDLDACSGCKACVTACHSLNGLEEGESWRSVGLLLDRSDARRPPSSTALQHVTTACHHCVDPACLHGCPVLAYEKDPVTGIVRHLDDQCIGCSYCTLMCPYEVPRFSTRLGIVRKCDLCQDRLAAGEAPACVQACPNEAIEVTLVEARALVSAFRPGSPVSPTVPLFLPDAPDPSLTVPTTRYVSASGRSLPLVAADRTHTVPATPHSPLTIFLVLSQGSVGLVAAAGIRAMFDRPAPPWTWSAAFLIQLASLAIATSHLGQPQRAWRSFLGWRRSWFSREVLVFGAYTALLAPLALIAVGVSLPGRLVAVLPPAVLLLGLLGVGTSAMIYVATRRAYWAAVPTFGRFLGTVLLLGAVSVPSPVVALALALLALAAKVPGEVLPVLNRALPPDGELGRTRSLLLGPLRTLVRTRYTLAAFGIACLLLRLLPASTASPLPVVLGTALLLAGELIERHLFFVAVAPQRMPGAVPV